MTSGDSTPSADLHPDAGPDPVRTHRRALRVLVAGQVTGGIGTGAALSVGGLLAEELTGSRSWAGTATTMLVLGAAIFAIPLSAISSTRGRRRGLTIGLLAALGGAVLAVAAAAYGLFPGYLAGLLLFGAGNATNLQMRFAATDLAPPASRARDLSVVVWATTIGAVLGPNLTGPGAVVADAFGLPELVGPLLFSTAAFAVSTVIVGLLLRPDPLLLAQRLAAAGSSDRTTAGESSVSDGPVAMRASAGARPAGGTGEPAVSVSFGAALRTILAAPRARFAFTAIAASHAVMVSVMAMAPVHMKGETHATLTIVGVAISLHIAGMYALSPLVGWLADRLGRPAVILAGQVILLNSITIGALVNQSHAGVMVALFLLGVGWSCGLVGGSTLLAESLDVATRVRAAGVSDLAMNLAGAGGGALAGLILAQFGFTGLNLLAGLLTVPVLLLGLLLPRPSARPEEPAGEPANQPN